MTMFSQRHYKAIASVVWRIVPENDGTENHISRSLLIMDLCDVFKRDNARFDEDKFRKAVDGPENPV